MNQLFCSDHSVYYHNPENECIWCSYDLLNLSTKSYKCKFCDIKILWGESQNYIKEIVAERCWKHL